MIKDHLGRSFKTLRISLTSTCNLGCVYCISEAQDGNQPLNGFTTNGMKPLPYQDLVEIVRNLYQKLDLKVVRLTGGEPLLYKELVPLVKALKQMGIAEIKLTSNAFLLDKFAHDLKKAGATAINISLDAVDEKSFKEISRRKNIKPVMDGIQASLDAGLDLKINAVIMRHMNENQIIPLLKFARDKNIPIRFLELMKMGHLFESGDDHFFPQQDILDEISQHFQFNPVARKPSSTANYWEMDDGYRFGIIANESAPFCTDCNRLRLDSYGKIYGCLSKNDGINIKDSAKNDFQLTENLKLALAQKQETKFEGSNISMKAIGG